MFERVLVGVDGRPGGADAITLATRLLADEGTLTLVHVHGGGFRSRHGGSAARHGTSAARHGASAESAEAAAEREALAMLEAQRSAAEVEAELLSVCAGSPGRGLHLLAERRKADLIVVGSCSHSGFGRAMLGDDTRAALNGAPCAVAIAVRGYFEHPVPIATIGVGYDGSPESEQALRAARRLAARNRALIRALHVVSLPSYSFVGISAPAVGENVDALLADARRQVDGLEEVEGRAVYGLPGEELASFGEEVDLLVVGSRSYGPLKRLVLGSTSNHLQRHARCSLLVLPRSATTPNAGSAHLSNSPQARAHPER